jgi:hypothetical protein
MVLTDEPGVAAALSAAGGWRYVEGATDGPLWTDGFSNVVGVFRWTGGAQE